MLQDLLDDTYGLLLYDVPLCSASLLFQMHVELLVAFPLPKPDI